MTHISQKADFFKLTASGTNQSTIKARFDIILLTIIEFLPVLSIPSEINNVGVEVKLLWSLVNQKSLDADRLLEKGKNENTGGDSFMF